MEYGVHVPSAARASGFGSDSDSVTVANEQQEEWQVQAWKAWQSIRVFRAKRLEGPPLLLPRRGTEASRRALDGERVLCYLGIISWGLSREM